VSITLSNEFWISAGPEEAFDLLIDVERIAPAIPGAQLIGPREGADGGYDARMEMRLGMVTLSYAGSIDIADVDRGQRTAVMRAKGRDRRGQGTANATMALAVAPSGDGSNVSIQSDIDVTGRVAQMGRGIMADVAERMIKDMAKSLEATFAASQPPDPAGAPSPSPAPPAPPAKAPNGLAIMATVIWKRLRRRLRLRPARSEH
jgi:carbon monoxide dehydrogenase subunit G